MNKCNFLDEFGTFSLEGAENINYLYFPIAGENGIKSAVTPTLGGDSKAGQNQFLLQPVSAEELHNNRSTRNFWCKIKNEELWSATGASSESQSKRFTGKQEESCVTAGIMWHRAERKNSHNGLIARITSFVPHIAQNVEVMWVELKNSGTETISFVPAAAVPIYGRSADNIRDHRHVTSLLHRIETIENGVVVTPTLSFDERGHQLNQTTYFVCGFQGDGEFPDGFYPCAEDFIGEGGSYDHPGALIQNLPVCKPGTGIDGYEAMGGIVFREKKLNPGEAAEYIILMGITGQRKEIGKICGQLCSSNLIAKVFEDTKRYWKQKVNVSFVTGDSEFDGFMKWVCFQPMLRRIYGCSFLPHHDYGKGGRGWRDLWQDCLALLIMNPAGVREMLTDNFAGVRMDGTNATIIGNRQGEFIADRNSITRVWMDHGVWPMITTSLYIHQTGDLLLLLRKNTYFKDKQVQRGTGKDELWDDGAKTVQLDKNGEIYYGTLLEHLLLQHLTAFYDVGEHNHIRLRGADWNDAIDMAAERGESVAFTAAYAGNLEILAGFIEELAGRAGQSTIEVGEEMEELFADSSDLYDSVYKKTELLKRYMKKCIHTVTGRKLYIPVSAAAASLRNKSQWMKQHIRNCEWIEEEDGGWFNGYYDNHGRKVEGIYETGIRMMLTSQVFTIMSKTASEKQVKEMIKSADRYLYQEKIGGYRLNTDFHELKTDMGRMFGFAYGHKENGAVFSHMTAMYANALYQRGFVKEGYKALNTLYRQSMDFTVSKIYPGIPEYFNDRGRGMYHYLTGAASWYMLTAVTEMFGVKGVMGNMCFEPKLIKEQFNERHQAELSMTFGERKWKVIYTNNAGREYGGYTISQLWLDGEQFKCSDGKAMISSEKIRSLSAEAVHEVIVVLK